MKERLITFLVISALLILWITISSYTQSKDVVVKLYFKARNIRLRILWWLVNG